MEGGEEEHKGVEGVAAIARTPPLAPSRAEVTMVARRRRLAGTQAALGCAHAHGSESGTCAACQGVDLTALKAILEPAAAVAAPVPVAFDTASEHEAAMLQRSVFAIGHVRDTASHVLGASSRTPAGILRSVLLEVATPAQELNAGMLSKVVAYMYEQAADSWPGEKKAQLQIAVAAATQLASKSVAASTDHDHDQEGELTLERLGIGPIVTQAVASVLQTIHRCVLCAVGCGGSAVRSWC